jgi:hypothetical protein
VDGDRGARVIKESVGELRQLAGRDHLRGCLDRAPSTSANSSRAIVL